MGAAVRRVLRTKRRQVLSGTLGRSDVVVSVDRPHATLDVADNGGGLNVFTRGLLTLTTPTNDMADWIASGRSNVHAQLAADASGLRFSR